MSFLAFERDISIASEAIQMGCSILAAVCRTVLHVGQEIPVTLVLRQLIEKSFPEEYEARRREERRLSSDAELLLPLFVMSLILPGLTLPLKSLQQYVGS